MDEMQTWTSIRSIVRRRAKVFLGVFGGVFLTAVVVALALPPVYRSSARVLIEEQQIPQEYVKTTVTSYVEERLQQISQQVLSRATLLEIVNRFNLYADMRTGHSVEDLVDRLRAAIELKTVSADVVDKKTGRPASATVAFTLSYQGPNPSLAQKVADTLASLYLAENLKSREQQASSTTAFLEQERDQLRTQTEALEAKIGAFKRAHLGEMPGYDAVNLQSLDRATRDVDHLNSEVRTLQERKVYLEGQLATVDPLAGDATRDQTSPRRRLKEVRLRLSMLRGVVSDEHPDVKAAKKEIRELETQVGRPDDSAERASQLAGLKEELARKQAEVGPRHPDVVALAREVDAVSRDLATAPSAPGESDNPAYINLRTQIASTDLEIKGLLDERRRAEGKVREFEQKLARAPLAEQDYSRLTRDYQTAQRRYDELTNKLMEARVAQGMEESQRGERFTIVDPAEYPEKPFKPNRLAIALIGFVLALGAGVGLAAAQESLDHSVKSAAEVQAFTEISVLCTLPFVDEETDPRNRRARGTRWLVAACLVLALALAATHWFVVPLDVLWFKVGRRLP